MDEEDVKNGAWLGIRMAIIFIIVTILFLGSMFVNLLCE